MKKLEIFRKSQKLKFFHQMYNLKVISGVQGFTRITLYISRNNGVIQIQDKFK